MNRISIAAISCILILFVAGSVESQSGALYCRICHQFFSDENSYLAHMRSAHGVGRSGNNNTQSSGPSAAQIAAQQRAAADREEEEQAERDAEAKAVAEKAAQDRKVADQLKEGKEALRELRDISQDADSDFKGLNDTSSDSKGFKTLPDVNADSNVVDGRKVLSGLPKFMDDAIASGYAGAPAGVSDNVRKGFQAIAAHQWNVAKAWFGTALNHDPDNAGLKHLVELADHTEKYIQRRNTGKSRNSSSPRSAMQLPKESDIQYLFPGLPAIEARELNDYILDQAIKATETLPVN